MLLVSCCGERGGVHIVNENTKNVKKILDIETRGIVYDNERKNIIIASSYKQSLIRFDLNFDIIDQTDIPPDIHGLFLYKDKLFLVDTRYDRIDVYDYNFSKIYSNDYKKIINELTNNNYYEDFDLLHLNDIFINNDIMYVSMFRDVCDIDKKNDRLYPNIGVIKAKNVSDDLSMGAVVVNNLTQPHSTFIFNETLFICNSRYSTIRIYDLHKLNLKKTINVNEGFLRGLCLSSDGSKIFAGSSSSEDRKSNNDFEVKCNITVFDSDSLEKLDKIDIDAVEIYSIIYLDDDQLNF